MVDPIECKLETCNVVFVPRHWKTRYCSKGCRDAARTLRNRSGVCPKCGGSKAPQAEVCQPCRFKSVNGRYMPPEERKELIASVVEGSDACPCGDEIYARGLCRSDYFWAHSNDLLDLALDPQRPPIDYEADGRECAKCGEWLPWAEFVKRGSKHKPRCRRCRRDDHLMRTYGISLEDYDRMYEAQGGTCANLKCPNDGLTPETGQVSGVGLYPHHDHLMQELYGIKVVLGLLCHFCNVVAGGQGESPERLRGLADFIESKAQLQFIN